MTSNRTAMTRRVVIAWINEILLKKNWHGTQLARAAGLAPSTVLRILNDPRHEFVPTFRTMQKIADASGISMPPSLVDALTQNRISESEMGRIAETVDQTKRALELRKTVPLRVVGPRMKDTVTTTVPCPPQLAEDETVIAFRMPDYSLEPFIRRGSLVFTTRQRTFIVDDVVLVITDQGDSFVGIVKAFDGSKIVIGGFRPDVPDKEIAFAKIDCIAVLAAYVA